MTTRNKRASSVGILLSFVLAPPAPDGAINQADRQHAAWTYSGILASGATLSSRPHWRMGGIPVGVQARMPVRRPVLVRGIGIARTRPHEAAATAVIGLPALPPATLFELVGAGVIKGTVKAAGPGAIAGGRVRRVGKTIRWRLIATMGEMGALDVVATATVDIATALLREEDEVLRIFELQCTQEQASHVAS